MVLSRLPLFWMTSCKSKGTPQMPPHFMMVLNSPYIGRLISLGGSGIAGVGPLNSHELFWIHPRSLTVRP